MLKEIEELRVKAIQLEELSDVLEKRICQQEKQSNKEWLSALKSIRLDTAEIKSAIELLQNLQNFIS